MARFSMTKHIAAPPDRVFAVFTNFGDAPEHIQNITKLEVLTDGPIRVGTRFRETRVMFKRECTEDMEITAFDPGRSYVVGCRSCGCDFRTTFRMEPSAGGTTVHVEYDSSPVTFMAKLLSPLGKLMASSCMKIFEQDMEDLRGVAEGGPTPDPQAQPQAAS